MAQDILAQEQLLLRHVLQPERVLPFLRPGRLVCVREGPLDWGWGVVLAVHQTTQPASVKDEPSSVKVQIHNPMCKPSS